MPRTMTMTTPSSLTRLAVGAALAGTLLLSAAPVASADRAPLPGVTPASSTAVRLPSGAETTQAVTADSRMASALTSRVTTARFGTSFSGAVVDVGSNATVWSRNATTARMPASTLKLVTATNALTVFGPDARFTTQVRTGSAANRVVLVGSGDPSLSSGGIDAMARRTASRLVAQGITTARVYVDDDVFPVPSLAYGWKESYVPDSITPVRGLVRDQRDVADTGADAGRYFRDRLKAHGITTAGYYGRTNAAATSTRITSTTGQPVSTMVSRMLLTSDNEVAEALHKKVGIALGYGATWAGARSAQAKALSTQKLTSGTLYDGSGLSRSDRLSPLQLTRILDRGLDPTLQARLWPLQSAAAMPTAGRTGTLASRFTTSQSKCAVGRLWAKTGSLSDVVSLAGFTRGADGRLKAFAFLVNGKDASTTLKNNIDMLGATVTGCY
jgi:serine-type D-Ala-D-Ala carboxypeptidase/endopeptidase (penicillin-binding protein 4)